MIVTVSPNPSLDRTLYIEALDRGTIIRANDNALLDPSGKGVNVSRVLHAQGVDTIAVLPVGGVNGDSLVSLLDVRHRVVPIAGNIRSNVSIVEPDGTVTKLNEPGPVLTDDDVTRLLEAVDGFDADWIVGSGSLPRGVDADFYARLDHGRIAIDTSGEALRKAIDAGVELVKPNLDELEFAAGTRLSTIGDAIDAARRIQDRGIRTVVASLGADGALYVGEDVLYGAARVDVLRSAVGAGDALLAGVLAAYGDPVRALTNGLAWAAATCALPGSGIPAAGDVDRAVVTLAAPDPKRALGRS